MSELLTQRKNKNKTQENDDRQQESKIVVVRSAICDLLVRTSGCGFEFSKGIPDKSDGQACLSHARVTENDEFESVVVVILLVVVVVVLAILEHHHDTDDTDADADARTEIY